MRPAFENDNAVAPVGKVKKIKGNTMKNKSLKILRVEKGLTQAQMGAALGVSRQMYAKVENGQSDGTIQFWGRLQRNFGITNEQMWELMNNRKEPAEV